MIHLWRDIELMKNCNWNTQWILRRRNTFQQKKTISDEKSCQGISILIVKWGPKHHRIGQIWKLSHQVKIVIFFYLLANLWCDILVGNPDLDIRTTSRTPQHLSCCNTSPCSYDPGDCELLGFIQRMKCGVVFSKRCINWNSWPYTPKCWINRIQESRLLSSINNHLHWTIWKEISFLTIQWFRIINE